MRWFANLASIACVVCVSSCGDKYDAGPAPHTVGFLLECQHAATGCESCHPAGQPLGAVDDACIACHLDARPASHDPETTAVCGDCHVGSCGWQGVGSPHPDGFAEPELHGLEAKLQGPTEGDCRDCHGADLRGGTSPVGGAAQGCDDCHAENGHADWRTDCVYCHGGADDASGAPPRDIDGETAVDRLSFTAHADHLTADPSYRTLSCTECHLDRVDALSDNHWWDSSPARAEVDFSRGIGAQTTWDGKTCANDYCHGSGTTYDGVVEDAPDPTFGCDSCHPTTSGWEAMTGLHEAHLARDPDIACNDCHGAVIDRQGDIATGSRHVDGLKDVSFYETTITSADGGGTCAGVCHGYDHDTLGWGHVPNYEEPELHGVDSNLRVLDCGGCHGVDWTGGVAQGCDDCHATEGHADWRTDCVFCHGGTGGDASGAPPQDLDDTAATANLSFQAHRDHVGTSAIGHPSYGCDQCHVAPASALDVGHAVDATFGLAEVTLAAGTSSEGGYDAASKACSNLYCHGDGQVPSGTIADGSAPLDCDSCHAYASDRASMSGTHEAHLAVAGVTCADCHAPVVNAAGDVVAPDRHVDRAVDLDLGATGFSPAAGACTITCHNVEHDQLGWAGNHPDGYDDPLAHGQEALLRLQTCTGSACHGADLDGGPGPGCDECHELGWRSDCTYCHGGLDGDVDGVPPVDIDNETDENRISFRAHPEHVEGRISRAYACEVCHAASVSYADAVTDPGHWLVDSTKTVAEVQFTGLASGANYAAGNCSNDYCHGNGQVNGASLDGGAALTCNGCHVYDQNLTQLSGTHALHLGVSGVSCADCHGGVVDAAGDVTSPNRHVDGSIDIDAAAGWDGATSSCTTSCHNHDHQGQIWTGHHPSGYDQPTVHGQEALFVQQDCASSGCHGTALDGGASGQGCESCHTPNWRQDCVFCHGGALGDTDGLPPSDLDDITDQDQISFLAHPEHHDSDDHKSLDCFQCHGDAASDYTDAFTDPGHWWTADASVGRAEVDFSDGLSPAGAYNLSSGSCSGLYCHGNGLTDSATVSDGRTALSCDGCHPTVQNQGQLSGTHDAHLAVVGVTCEDCHAPVVDPSNAVVTPGMHVNGALDVDVASTGWDGATQSCAIVCHNVDHDGITWEAYHPPGYDDPLSHGQDALMRLDTCADAGCHGADLRGGPGDSCDSCHVAGWRSNCTYCHGGASGDTRGAPPEDLDNDTNANTISFRAHPEHTDADIHPLYACDTCHTGAAAYLDAVTDVGHWLVTDATAGKAEVKFNGIATGSTYSGGTCANDYCHGNGQVNGTISDGTTSLTCNGCHAYDQNQADLSGTHALHLGVSGVSCADCHSDVSAVGAITNATKHVNALTDVDQVNTGWVSNSESCTISCHSHNHTNTPWVGGHPPGYDAPDVHGQEALFKTQDCASAGCHGTDLRGGSSGVSCDDCHVSGWRSDCTYCHGGQLGDADGLPPEDLDNVTDEAQITFMAHPEHHDATDHPVYDCNECHGDVTLSYSDAFLDPGHWWTGELTPGLADIDMSDGLSPAGTYNATTGTCSNLYCHGNGNGALDSQTDSNNALNCHACHPDSTSGSLSGMSGDHSDHDGEDCSDCHSTVVGTNQTTIVGDALHVDGAKQAVPTAATGITFTRSGSTITCSGGKCHGQDHSHSGDRW